MACIQLVVVVIVHKWAWDQLGKINGLLVLQKWEAKAKLDSSI
jgi:hypothetical protein